MWSDHTSPDADTVRIDLRLSVCVIDSDNSAIWIEASGISALGLFKDLRFDAAPALAAATVKLFTAEQAGFDLGHLELAVAAFVDRRIGGARDVVGAVPVRVRVEFAALDGVGDRIVAQAVRAADLAGLAQ